MCKGSETKQSACSRHGKKGSVAEAQEQGKNGDNSRRSGWPDHARPSGHINSSDPKNSGESLKDLSREMK